MMYYRIYYIDNNGETKRDHVDEFKLVDYDKQYKITNVFLIPEDKFNEMTHGKLNKENKEFVPNLETTEPTITIKKEKKNKSKKNENDEDKQ